MLQQVDPPPNNDARINDKIQWEIHDLEDHCEFEDAGSRDVSLAVKKNRLRLGFLLSLPMGLIHETLLKSPVLQCPDEIAVVVPSMLSCSTASAPRVAR